MLQSLDDLLATVRACDICAGALPLGPRPILQASRSATLLVASQAPGTKAHASGIPFSDPSGDRLREWMGITDEAFYDPSRIAIVPMGLCYPGKGKSGDAPPRPECARTWRRPLLDLMPAIRLTLLVGSHAQQGVLGPGNMTERVRNFRDFLPEVFPLPHPSWRSTIWMRANPWFEAEVLPALKEEVRRTLQASG